MQWDGRTAAGTADLSGQHGHGQCLHPVQRQGRNYRQPLQDLPWPGPNSAHARQVTVNVPGGVDDGTRIRQGGWGEPGENGGPAGNLQVVLKVEPHEFFHRREADIVVDMPINIAQAALGATITVPTVDGDERLKIPEGTQTGKVFRLRNHGAPKIRTDGTSNGRGDH